MTRFQVGRDLWRRARSGWQQHYRGVLFEAAVVLLAILMMPVVVVAMGVGILLAIAFASVYASRALLHAIRRSANDRSEGFAAQPVPVPWARRAVARPVQVVWGTRSIRFWPPDGVSVRREWWW